MSLHNLLAQRPAVLCHALTLVVVQTFGKVRASTNGGRPSKESGPLRYVPKISLSKGQVHQKSSHETGTADVRDFDDKSGPSNKETDGETRTKPKSGHNKNSVRVRWTDRNSANDQSVSPAWLGFVGGLNGEDSKLKTGELGNEFWGSDRSDPDYFTEESGGSRSGKSSSNEDTRTLAKNYCMTLLARGPQTACQIRSKLTRRNVGPEVIEDILKELQRCGLQSDEEYTDLFARSRWHDNSWGPLRIKFELHKRGVSKEIAEAGIANLFQTSHQVGGEQDKLEDLDKFGMTSEATDHLMYRVRQRWAQGRDLEISVRRRRLSGWLQRRGFDWSVIADVLKSLESQSSSDSED